LKNGREGHRNHAVSEKTKSFLLKTARFLLKLIDFNILHFDKFCKSC
jgi:hypothetical protein